MKRIKKLQASLLILFVLIVTNSFSQTIVNTAINVGENDDAEERISDGVMDLTSSDLEFCVDDDGDQLVGIRFQNVNVPQGAAISNAYIQFQVDESINQGAITIDIEGIDVDNASVFTGANFNISQRVDGTISSGTSATSSWSPVDWASVGAQGTDQQTSSLTTIVKEIVDRPGWSANNDMAFVFSPNSGSPARRYAEDGDVANEGAILHIEYLTGPPEIDITGNSVSITDGDTTPDLADNTQFGTVSVGQFRDHTYTIINEGTGVINLTGSVLSGDSEFTAVNPPIVPVALSSGESLDFTIRFTPTTTATFNGQISITNDDSDENPYTFDIQGTGVTPDVEIDVLDTYSNAINDGGGNSPSIINSTEFGGTDATNPIAVNFRIENNGTTDLTIGTPSSSNSDFAITSSPSTTILGSSFSIFEITFTPSSAGLISSTITITNDDTDENPYTFTVQGTGYLSQSYISSGDSWSYYDSSQQPPDDAQGDTWVENDFNDGGWSSDNAPLGYGDMNGVGLSNINASTEVAYFRKTFNVIDHSLYNSLALEAVRDDGMVVYINGTEVWRDNMDAGAVSYSTFANTVVGGTGEGAWITQSLSNVLVTGSNVIAVEVHQENAGSSDISFDFKLDASAAPVSNSVSRGPYLQSGTDTSVIVRWRTDVATDTKVNYGSSLVSLSSSVSDPTLTTEHEIQITGLTPNTKYYYNLENAGGVYLTENNNMFIYTAPTIGTRQFVRAWILGDAGTSGNDTYGDDQEEVRDAYYNYVSNTAQFPNQTDMMLFLGDNAYNSGTDTEYQKGLFNIYDDMLKKSVAWSCLGNHDAGSANSLSQSGVYYDIFSFPKAAEAGGTVSSTEAYYSFDYANIHFIVLESQTTDGTFRGAQETWVTNDIAATTQDWIVALFHHPPYTKGSHDSDTESQLVYMRENFLPLLEAGGVDLTLSGHSHSYERSKFINGRTGSTNSDALDSGQPGAGITVGANGNLSGKADTADGAYEKSASPDGAVYITTGSAGKATTGSINHAAMYYSVLDIGSTILEIEEDGLGGQNMNVKFLSDDNHDYTFAINDYFTIHKPSTALTVDSIDDNSRDVNIYPVPTNGFINIKLANNEQLQNVKFYNTIGALVKQSTKEQINVNGLKSGVYMIEITSDKSTYYKSIIIE